MKNKKSDEVRICKKCGVKMNTVYESRRLLEPDEMGDMTDAEASEYEAVDMGGDSGDFEINQIICECSRCHDTTTVEFL